MASGVVLGSPAMAETVDEAEIKTIVESVATFADRGEFDALATLYADEFLLDYSSLNAQPVELRSPKSLMLEWAAVLPGFDRTRHEIEDIVVTIEGAQANATADFTAAHWIDEAYWELSGTYTYAFEKDGRGPWEITSMTMTAGEERGTREVFGPAMERAAREPADIVIREQAKQAVLDFLEGLETFDMDRVNAVWAEDAIQDMPYAPEGFPSRVIGREEIIALYAAWPDTVRNPVFTEGLVFHPSSDPEIVFAEWTGTVDVIATGRRYKQTYGGLFHVEQGKITLYREYFDPRPFAWAFGLSEVVSDGK